MEKRELEFDEAIAKASEVLEADKDVLDKNYRKIEKLSAYYFVDDIKSQACIVGLGNTTLVISKLVPFEDAVQQYRESLKQCK